VALVVVLSVLLGSKKACGLKDLGECELDLDDSMLGVGVTESDIELFLLELAASVSLFSDCDCKSK
jgi:hypothetical protein